MQLMVTNAETFNGVQSIIAIEAAALLSALRLALLHEREQLGADKDELAVLEAAIRRRCVCVYLCAYKCV